jgi:hypothetical protein
MRGQPGSDCVRDFMNYSKLTALLFACLGWAMFSASGQTWDARDGFSTTNNPNGQWTYGWSTTLSGSVTTYPTYYVQSASVIDTWSDASIREDECPHVCWYPGNSQYWYVPPHSMLIQAGPENQFSHCIWTAPTSGTYSIQASFTALDFGTPHGYILLNGTAIGDSYLPLGTEKDFTFTSMVLAAGDTIDLVAGVGDDDAYFNDESAFTLTITFGPGGGVTTPVGPPVQGVYSGLLNPSGPGLAGGSVLVRVAPSGSFTGMINWGGKRVPIKGAFGQSTGYSALVSMPGGAQATVTLSFDTSGNLTGTLSENGTVYGLSAEVVSNRGTAGGYYAFTISPDATTANIPGGTGFGYLYVHPSGLVSMVGLLGDGKTFSASSWVTSGTSMALFANPYQTNGSGISGSVTFEDIPGQSDCDGSLYWSRAQEGSNSPYPQAFGTSCNLKASQITGVIGGLNDDPASFTADGSNFAGVSEGITLHSTASGISGTTSDILLRIHPESAFFSGFFTDSVTGQRYPFAGILQPKSRSGAGIIVSGGLTGSVSIYY